MTSFQSLPQWVGYKTKPKLRDGQPVIKDNGKPKLDKVPVNPRTGGNAQTNNPQTWTDFDTARDAIEKYSLDGVGFVFTKDAGVTGIDLDDCVDADGNLSEHAQRIVDLLGSYAEFSPSGDGVHILVRGTIPRGFKNGQVEMYDSGRFFTYTGNAVPGYGVGIRNRQQQLDQLWLEVAGGEKKDESRQPAPGPVIDLDDRELLDRAMNAENGAKFRALWHGDTAGYASQSEADLALCHLLAFWTGNDPSGMDRLFRQSALFREKWDERHYSNGATYGQQTILRAIANTTEVYRPGHGRAPKPVTARPETPDADRELGSAMPPLPDVASLDPDIGLDACPWLDRYVAFSRRMSPRGYDGFHEAIGLWILSIIAARRLVLQLGIKAFYPNLFVALCAHTTLFAKTTTARVAQDVLQAAGLSYLLLPNDMTPQAFVNELAPRLRPDYSEMSKEQRQLERLRLAFAGQRGWFYEEFGTKIQAMMRDSGFMAEFRGLLRTFDDNQECYRYFTMTRHDDVERPYLALLANMTPADVRPYAKPGSALWQDGFWARWAFVTPPVDHPPSFGRFPDEPESIPEELTNPLGRWHEALGVPSVRVEEVLNEDGEPGGSYSVQREDLRPRACSLREGVMDAYYTYHDALVVLAAEQAKQGTTDLIGNYGRFAEKAIRVAMLLAGVGSENRIELSHWVRAQTITEGWRANLHALAQQVSEPGPSQERQLQEKIVDVLKRLGPSTPADIGRYIHNVSGPEVDDVCRRLTKSGVLIEVETTRVGTKRYSWPNRRQ